MDGDATRTIVGAPYNWCDGMCERCPQVPRCPVGSVAAEEPGCDPNPGPPPLARVCAAFLVLTRAVQGDAELSAGLRLRTAGARYAHAALELLRAAGHEVAPDGVRPHALVLQLKLARIADSVAPSGRLDRSRVEAVLAAAPTVLLIDRIERSLAMRVEPWARERAAGADFRCAREAFRTLLSPLLNDVPHEVRLEVADRIRDGSAPSPFLTTDNPVEHSRRAS